MSRDILLVKLETQKYFYIPYGLLYTADSLRKAGFKVTLLHEHEKNIEKIIKKAQEIKPLLVCFSAMTSSALKPTIEASRKIKDLGFTVVWGGMHSTILPEVSLDENSVDFIVIGDGEETIKALAKELIKKKGSFHKIKGIGFKENEKKIINPKRILIKNLDKYEPALDLIDVTKYWMNFFGLDRVLPIISSRGCPFRCGFCYNLAVNERLWRAHSVWHVMKIINYFKKQGMNGIFFHDDNFFVNIKRAKEIIKQANLPWSAEIRADIVTSELAKWLDESDCRMIFVGAESGSQRILDYMKKDITVEDLYNTAKNMKDKKTNVDLSFIIGFPVETKEDKTKTFRVIDDLQKINPKVNATVKIYTPYPSTPLWLEALNYGFKPPATNIEWSEFGRERCFLPWVNNKELEAIHRISVYACTKIKEFLPAGHKFLYPIEKFRWQNNIYAFPIELYTVDLARSMLAKLRKYKLAK